MFINPAFAQATGTPGRGRFPRHDPALVMIMVVFWFLLIRPQQRKHEGASGIDRQGLARRHDRDDGRPDRQGQQGCRRARTPGRDRRECEGSRVRAAPSPRCAPRASRSRDEIAASNALFLPLEDHRHSALGGGCDSFRVAQHPPARPAEDIWRKRTILRPMTLGLDLQGGSNVLLEVDRRDLTDSMLKQQMGDIRSALARGAHRLQAQPQSARRHGADHRSRKMPTRPKRF